MPDRQPGQRLIQRAENVANRIHAFEAPEGRGHEASSVIRDLLAELAAREQQLQDVKGELDRTQRAHYQAELEVRELRGLRDELAEALRQIEAYRFSPQSDIARKALAYVSVPPQDNDKGGTNGD